MNAVALRSGSVMAISFAVLLVASAGAQDASKQDLPQIEIVPNVAHSVLSAAFSPDGTQLVSAGSDKTVKLWDAASGKLLRTFRGHSDEINAVAFSSDGARLASASKDATLKLWNLANGQVLRTFEGHTDSANALAFSPDGTRLVSGSDDTSVKLWDTTTGQLLRTFEGHTDEVNAVAFSPDGTRVLSGSEDDTLKLWDAATGRLLNTFDGHAESVHAVAFSPDGTRIASGSDDKTVKLWDVATGRLVQTFEGHREGIYSVAFSPDGSRLLSGGEDTTVRLWDTASARLLRTLAGHTKDVETVAFSPDGLRFLSGAADGRTIIWDATSGVSRVSLLATPEGEWVAITPAGYFAASRTGADLLGVVRGLEPYSLMQFYEQLCRPDLVDDALKGDPEGKLKDAESQLNLQSILNSGAAPQIELLEKKADANDAVGIAVNVRDAGGGIGRKVVWRVNGKAQGELATPPSRNGGVTITQTLKLDSSQPNTIAVTAYNGAGLLATAPFRIVVDSFGGVSQERPRLHVLAVGVDKYATPDLELHYAVKDAKDVADVLRVAGRPIYSDVKVTTLFDADVSKAGIETAINKLAADVRPTDAFVLYLAGQGRSPAGRYVFLPQAFDPAKEQTIEADGIGQELWQLWLAKISAQQTLLILDASDCAPSAGLLTALVRGNRERHAAMEQLQYATGQNLIAAVRQSAYESYRDHGVLAGAILDAFQKPQNAGSPERVEVDWLARTLSEQVLQITKTVYGVAQAPFYKLPGSNFALGVKLVGDPSSAAQKSAITVH